MTPNEAAKDPDEAVRIEIERHEEARKEQRDEFRVGDRVRLKKEKTIVSKGYEAHYSHEVHTIESVQGNYYTLSDGRTDYRECMTRHR